MPVKGCKDAHYDKYINQSISIHLHLRLKWRKTFDVSTLLVIKPYGAWMPKCPLPNLTISNACRDHSHACLTNQRTFNSNLSQIKYFHFDWNQIFKGRPDDHTLSAIPVNMCATPEKGSTTLTLRNRSEVQRTRKHRSRVEPVFIHVFSGCQGTVQPLEQLSQAAGGQRKRQPVQWQLE